MSNPLARAGRYQIISELGRGAMGVVYEAHDPVIGRTVAIKTMLVEGLSPSEYDAYRARFQREAQSAGVLAHPNIVTIYDFGEDQGILYLAMEFLQGKSLDRIMEDRSNVSPEKILLIYEQVCDAIDFAHSKGVVHRDIKPANIMILDKWQVKITDFGIAKMAEMGTTGLTRSGQILGTPNYMSPEQVKGRSVDGRSDIFSLGVILYELITGEKPFDGQNITTVIYKIMHENPIPPRDLDSTIHPGLSYVISKALAKSPDERYSTCGKLYEDLKNYRNLGEAPLAGAAPRGQVQPPAVVVSRPLLPMPWADSPSNRVTEAGGYGAPARIVDKPAATSIPAGPSAPFAGAVMGSARQAIPATAPRSPLVPAPGVQAADYLDSVISGEISKRPETPPEFEITPGAPSHREFEAEALPPGAVALNRRKSLIAWLILGGLVVVSMAIGYVLLHRHKPKSMVVANGSIVVSDDNANTTAQPAPMRPTSAISDSPRKAPAGKHPAGAPLKETGLPSAGAGMSARSSAAGPAKATDNARRAATEEPSGKVVVTSNIAGAQVILDGQVNPIWTAPYTFSLAPGRHLVAVSKQGYRPAKQEINIAAGSEQQVRIDLGLSSAAAAAPAETVHVLGSGDGEINIVTDPPGLEVLIDGKSVGTTPLQYYTSAGSHPCKVMPPPGKGVWDGTCTVNAGSILTKRLKY